MKTKKQSKPKAQKLPKNVQSALNVLYPKKQRDAIATLQEYVLSIQDQRDELNSKMEALYRKIDDCMRNAKDAAVLANTPPNSVVNSAKGAYRIEDFKDGKPRYRANYKRNWEIPQTIKPLIQQWYDDKEANKPRNELEQLSKSIDKKLVKALFPDHKSKQGIPDPVVFYDKTMVAWTDEFREFEIDIKNLNSEKQLLERERELLREKQNSIYRQYPLMFPGQMFPLLWMSR